MAPLMVVFWQVEEEGLQFGMEVTQLCAQQGLAQSIRLGPGDYRILTKQLYFLSLWCWVFVHAGQLIILNDMPT